MVAHKEPPARFSRWGLPVLCQSITSAGRGRPLPFVPETRPGRRSDSARYRGGDGVDQIPDFQNDVPLLTAVGAATDPLLIQNIGVHRDLAILEAERPLDRRVSRRVRVLCQIDHGFQFRVHQVERSSKFSLRSGSSKPDHVNEVTFAELDSVCGARAADPYPRTRRIFRLRFLRRARLRLLGSRDTLTRSIVNTALPVGTREIPLVEPATSTSIPSQCAGTGSACTVGRHPPAKRLRRRSGSRARARAGDPGPPFR